MDHHSAPERNERTTKWILDVAMRRRNRTSWSAANVALVATRRVGVGPGVNTLDHRSSTKDAISYWNIKDNGGNGLSNLSPVNHQYLHLI